MSHPTYAHAVCRPLPVRDVDVTGGFWKRIVDQSRTAGLPAVLTEYGERNVVKNFIDAAAGRERAKENNAGNYDEFLFKALEACGYYLAQPGTEALAEQYRRIRDIVLAIQQEDGYLNTLAQQNGTEHHSCRTVQELYAGGHLMQAGIAARETAGDSVLYDGARRYIDCLVKGYGVDGKGLNRHGQDKWPDHPNVEMALVELYRASGDSKYLAFCNAVLNHGQYRGRTQMTNHAVCEMLCATGGTDYYIETGDTEIWAATRRLWQDMLKKVYVTGGIGSTHRGTTHESVGKAYALTNDQAYTETCAAISLVFWAWRMGLATGEASYADMMERALYNGTLSGMSADGLEYFYENPLEYRAVNAPGSASLTDEHADFRGATWRRQAYHGCSCCPPNVQRLLASVQQYAYAVSGSAVWVNLFMGATARMTLGDRTVTLAQKTDYPWEGRSEITVSLEAPAAFALKIRIPAWCRAAGITVNGETAGADIAGGGYAEVARTWNDGDSVIVDLPMPARLVASHPKNLGNHEKLVIARGPVIYCLEGPDNPDIDIFDVVLPAGVRFTETLERNLLGGVVTLEAEARLADYGDWDAKPYREYDPGRAVTLRPVRIKAIPHFAWANRGKSDMITAIPYDRKGA